VQFCTTLALTGGRDRMATIQSEILDSFYSKLSKSETVDLAMIDSLRKLFQSGGKLKADDFVVILTKKKQESTL
jgi:hypothetical protein